MGFWDFGSFGVPWLYTWVPYYGLLIARATLVLSTSFPLRMLVFLGSGRRPASPASADEELRRCLQRDALRSLLVVHWNQVNKQIEKDRTGTFIPLRGD